ncbi:MAG TPA: molybdopterin cofactor-binding domain-containing protein [Dermatophilaceae bacterium]|nr:molybdopterin cofactor-binding domain-containing protein [Dermatophilaceae bacterium]
MSAPDALALARGDVRFVADLPLPEGTLHAHVVGAEVAHGRLRGVDTGAAAALPGVVAVLTARDVPGANLVGLVADDQPLLASDMFSHIGVPVALVVADGPATARAAAAAVAVHVTPLPPVTDAAEALRRGDRIVPPMRVELGDVGAAWERCAVVVSGHVETGAQEHAYLEAQAALVLPGEGGRLVVHCATQSPTGVQRAVARVCALTEEQVEVTAPRLGGAFGGKEEQATPWAALCALAARHTGRPVRLVLRRDDDMRMTGKRHPYSADVRIGADADGRLVAYEVTFVQDAGAFADLSGGVMERSLLHCTGAYAVPHVRATGHLCRTNLPPNTAFRGFGAPQAVFAIEAALDLLAGEMGVTREHLQRVNLVSDGVVRPHGQVLSDVHGRATWAALDKRCPPEEVRARTAAHNATHRWSRRGHAWVPVCFGVAFTSAELNQAGAVVQVYGDGSVGVATGAVEMGQGVDTKIRAVVARALSVRPGRVGVEATSTARVANTSPTAGSTGADLNGRAVEQACAALRHRLLAVAAEGLGRDDGDGLVLRDERVLEGDGRDTGWTWDRLVAAARHARVDLTAHGHHRTAGVHLERGGGLLRGEPFAYHVAGTALVEVVLDCLRGTYAVEAVHVVHDVGRSLDPAVDRGQVEGAVVQGLGWVTLEEVRHDADGRLLTDTLATYKVPDVLSTPEVVVEFLAGSEGSCAPYGSKAIGEPPFVYGIGAWFALREAMRAFRPERPCPVVAPLTPERVLTALYDGPAAVRDGSAP